MFKKVMQSDTEKIIIPICNINTFKCLTDNKRGDMEKILVIEDHLSVQKNIKQLLEKAKYEVLTADNGPEGIRLAIKKQPDLIICDIMMPDMNGYEVLEQLSAEKKTFTIPFIFLTAKVEMTDLRLGMELGADDYLTKPFRAGDLLKAVKKRLEKKENFVKGQEEKMSNKYCESTLRGNSVVVAGSHPEVLKVSEIVFISSSEGYSNICTKEGRNLLVRKLLKEWESILPKDQFLRIHQSTIINLEYMEKVEKWFNHTLRIYMTYYDKPLEVSKRYAPKVRARIML